MSASREPLLSAKCLFLYVISIYFSNLLLLMTNLIVSWGGTFFSIELLEIIAILNIFSLLFFRFLNEDSRSWDFSVLHNHTKRTYWLQCTLQKEEDRIRLGSNKRSPSEVTEWFWNCTLVSALFFSFSVILVSLIFLTRPPVDSFTSLA